jgi:hypothetical protein
MTDDPNRAYDEGMHREQGLFVDRKDWAMHDWWDRKLFLEDLLLHEDKRSDAWYSLLGRLQAVQLEGSRRFRKSMAP